MARRLRPRNAINPSPPNSGLSILQSLHIPLQVLDGLTKECILACPKLTTLVRTLNDLPAIKQWNAEKNPKLPWC